MVFITFPNQSLARLASLVSPAIQKLGKMTNFVASVSASACQSAKPWAYTSSCVKMISMGRQQISQS